MLDSQDIRCSIDRSPLQTLDSQDIKCSIEPSSISRTHDHTAIPFVSHLSPSFGEVSESFEDQLNSVEAKQLVFPVAILLTSLILSLLSAGSHAVVAGVLDVAGAFSASVASQQSSTAIGRCLRLQPGLPRQDLVKR